MRHCASARRHSAATAGDIRCDSTHTSPAAGADAGGARPTHTPPSRFGSAAAEGPADIARRVIGCSLAQETRVQNALDDEAGKSARQSDKI